MNFIGTGSSGMRLGALFSFFNRLTNKKITIILGITFSIVKNEVYIVMIFSIRNKLNNAYLRISGFCSTAGEAIIKYAPYIPYLVGATLISATKLLTVMGESSFRTEYTAGRFTREEHPDSPVTKAAAYIGVFFCGSVIILVGVPVIINGCLRKRNNSRSPQSTQVVAPMEAGAVTLLWMGQASLVLMAIPLFNGQLRFIDLCRGEVIDPNDETALNLLCALATSVMQLYYTYIISQKNYNENVISDRKIIDISNLQSIDVVIFTDTVIAAFLASQGVYGGLGKIPTKRLFDIEKVPEFTQNFLALTSFCVSGARRYFTNGRALKDSADDLFDMPSSALGKKYYAVTDIAGIGDSSISGVNAFGSVLFQIQKLGLDCKVPDLVDGNWKQKAVLPLAAFGGYVYGRSTWSFNVKRQRQRAATEYGVPFFRRAVGVVARPANYGSTTSADDAQENGRQSGSPSSLFGSSERHQKSVDVVLKVHSIHR